MANRLRDQRSPYLLQHADNPVDWRPWGEAALREARDANKPILLSIGYAACHWCHVMAHESFENAETAAQMNTLYVNIKVDREERPDIDALYMGALHALGQQGGWPLTMFLTPEAEPFWGGTYFPPEPRWGRPSFRQVLEGVARAFVAGDPAIARNTGALATAMEAQAATRPGDLPGPDLLDRVADALLKATDPVLGGMRGAPKFPNPPIFRLLWQQSQRTGREDLADAVRLLLARMSEGGIYDHLGGGYARYSTDAEWLAPHFEKMLYDNAQVLELLALAHAGRPDPLFATRAEETVGWMLRDMRADGAFAASEDADSEGEEGRFYVWDEAEVDQLLGDAAPAFKRAYDVSADGNWESHVILRRVLPPGADEASLARSRAMLLQARGLRVRPGRDDKILADWNGLAVAGLCRAAAVFARPDWLALAADAFDAVLTTMATPDGRVAHAARHGVVTAAGLLDDQASMARAALALHAATGEPVRLAQARAGAQAALDFFADADGSFFTSAADAVDVPAIRPRDAGDNAVPSGTGLIAEVFARLFHLTGEAAWRERAEAVLRAFGGAGNRLAAMPTLLAAADLLGDAVSVVVAGPADHPGTLALADAVLAAPDPVLCLLRAPEAASVAEGHPAAGKGGGDIPFAYVCRAGACSLPIADVAQLRARLREPRAGQEAHPP